MRRHLMGEALFEVGCHAAGWTAAILFLFGGGTLLFASANTYIEKPFVQVLAWGQVFVLAAGLVLMAVGHVLRRAGGDSDPPDWADRVRALEEEVARLRARLDPEPPPNEHVRR